MQRARAIRKTPRAATAIPEPALVESEPAESLCAPSASRDKAAEISLDECALYINRELSLLEFQMRVLEEARDGRNKLLERVKFLSIVNSNLDEFFMVRVAALKQKLSTGILDLSIDGR